ncbi:MAG: LapA family protein [Rubrivivax sp.]
MQVFVWAFRALIFFTLFAFALNNQQPANVHWFFGVQWQAPMVIVVLLAFAAGCALGVVAMVPSWWRQRRQVQKVATPVQPPQRADSGPAASDFVLEHPPRDGL